MKRFHCKDATWFLSAAAGLLVLLLFSITAQASDARYLWQSRDQFVALERQDTVSGGPAQPNDHPVEMTLERLTALLSSIDMRATDGGKAEHLLTSSAVQTLAPYLRQGLQQASPSEDVTFAVIGLHDALFGLAKSPKVTTGRIFYKAGRLNIIVGLVQQEVRDRDDRRLFPFTPGSRQKVSAGEWSLLTQTGQNGYNQVRRDWVAFSDEWRTPVVQTPVDEKNLPAVQTAPAQSAKPRPADRLTTLNELKQNGLITEDEYRAKRMEILNGL
jgi:hypothetical protein